MKNKDISEEDTKQRFITPALKQVGWDLAHIKMEYGISVGKINIKTGKRDKSTIKRADYVLFYNDTPLAVLEAKAYKYEDSEGLEQAKDYAKALKTPFAFSSSGKGFTKCTLSQDFKGAEKENLSLDSFPSPKELYDAYKKWQSLTDDSLLQRCCDLSETTPRYYQINAINAALLAAQKGAMRILLVLATGTGKTLIAYQIAHRLFNQTLPNGKKIEKILYLADRNELINTDTTEKFKSFTKGIYKIENRNFKSSYSLYFGIYQQFISGSEENNDKVEHYKALTKDFFDLIFIDECHRGSARADSTWREILEYFDSALQIGMTATPKYNKEQRQMQEAGELEKRDDDNIDYFGEPAYQYSLKQGIEDGYLAPFSVIEILSNAEQDGYTPELGKRDESGVEIPQETFTSPDFNRKIYLKPQIRYVAKEVSDFLHHTLKNPYAKTIIFCEDQRHALLMKDALEECLDIKKQMRKNDSYVTRITSSDEKGKSLLDDFKKVSKRYPVIATTSQLLSTGVDTQMVQVIVIDKIVRDKSLFKQMIGRGTRLNDVLESKGKTHFYVLDFKGIAKEFLNDPDFDGEIEFIGTDEIEKREKKPPIIKDPPPSPPTQKKHTIDGEEIYIRRESKATIILRNVNGILTPITQSLESFSGEKLKNTSSFESYLEILRTGDKEKREELLSMLEEKGIFIHELGQMDKFQNCDEFDILLSLAKGTQALSRKERAKKANKFLETLQPKARELLELLLEKYAQGGINQLDSGVFDNEPFASKYDPIIIEQIFEEYGGFSAIMQNLKNALYEEVS
ncbi:DEAD/DEAH box helicase family protein [Campylobacter upsaliensis]|uniref:EcoAI/FtnUII family type I restriction enzme subunit R n=1 Tax=Campylobacter upsaliensis TaxID=28080 RepID=UPI001279A425|nr:DEAD/DEAH box helicase family protein [Campylobacter upsaliensis]EAH5904306.1 DEAD/DEAH box helicase [Campylobacter upsaliensis]EAI0687551.1 DEAD/DEAH box helicase [Campylobacter upsaliensis]EAI7129671.1 DEAD/DEAH box helicase [Campylobacter upsaliensis]EAJ1706344.1 DEAD/DEAH box helicase [Campylobacter upsaliensis]EAK3777793.1 DEAD/DEAH box helicase [Campylobacter upsaliensis]